MNPAACREALGGVPILTIINNGNFEAGGFEEEGKFFGDVPCTEDDDALGVAVILEEDIYRAAATLIGIGAEDVVFRAARSVFEMFASGIEDEEFKLAAADSADEQVVATAGPDHLCASVAGRAATGFDHGDENKGCALLGEGCERTEDVKVSGHVLEW